MVLQTPLFFVLFRAFGNGQFTLLAWTAPLALGIGLAVGLRARRMGVGFYVVDACGRPVRRASRRRDGIPRVLRNRSIVSTDSPPLRVAQPWLSCASVSSLRCRLVGVTHPRRDVTMAVQYTPHIDVIVPSDVEHQVGEALKLPTPQRRDLQLHRVARRA